MGSITVHLDEETWTKGVVTTEEYDRVTRVFDSLVGKITTLSPTKEPQKVKIGSRLIERVLRNIQSGIKEADEQEIREILANNYPDYLRLKQIRGVKDEEEAKVEETSSLPD